MKLVNPYLKRSVDRFSYIDVPMERLVTCSTCTKSCRRRSLGKHTWCLLCVDWRCDY